MHPGPRLSHTGSRRSTRQSYLGGGSEAGQALVVYDPDQPGLDRTPKPLASIDTSLSNLKGKDAQAFLQGLESPASESSELRMLDRLGSVGSFSLRSGFESGRTSGNTSPKSEMDDEYELQQASLYPNTPLPTITLIT